MAKKTKAQQISREHLAAIAKRVIDTTNNAYPIAEQIIGGKVEDPDGLFDLLKEHEGIFRCENCNMWLPVQHESMTDWCIECCDGEGEE